MEIQFSNTVEDIEFMIKYHYLYKKRNAEQFK